MSDVEEEMNERAEMLTDLMAKATGPEIDVSYRIGGQWLENEGRVSLSLEFATVEDMMSFRARAGLQAHVRRADSLDGVEVQSGRKFTVSRHADELTRVARFETVETERED
jgi:hypothetical protein